MSTLDRSYDLVLIILETGVFEALDLESAHSERFPTLRRLAASGIFCRRHVSPFAGSTNAIFSIFSGIYPFPDYRSIMRIKPAVRVPSFVARLREAGYRTAVLTTIDANYDRMDEFLRAQGVEMLGDRNTLSLPPITGGEFGDDRVLMRVGADWLLADQKPGALILVPSNSHWPFFAPSLPPGERTRSPRERYLLAMDHQDAVLSELIGRLEAADRWQRTVLMVVPDHGVYLGLTGGAPDPTRLFSVHVPVIVSHPILRSENRSLPIDEVTSHVDIAPTIADLFGLPPADEWHGVSLLRRPDPSRLAFVAEDLDTWLVGGPNGRSIGWLDASRNFSVHSWPVRPRMGEGCGSGPDSSLPGPPLQTTVTGPEIGESVITPTELASFATYVTWTLEDWLDG